MQIRRAQLSLLVLGIAACAPSNAQDSDPVLGAWKDRDRWTLTAQASTGAEGELTFSRIVDVALDGAGRVWVADGQENQIRVFSPDGRLVRSVGRPGGGPAEFLGIAGMAWDPSGHLWVLDSGNMRWSVFDTAGALVATHRRASTTVVAPWPLGFDAEHRLYDLGSARIPGTEPRTILRFTADLQLRDSFDLPPFQAPVFEIERRAGTEINIEQVTVPFAGLQEWRVDPQGYVWVGVTDRYRLQRYGFDGTVDRVIERAVVPERIPRSRRSAIPGEYREFERRGGRIDASRIPATYPVFDGFFFGDDGTVWVKRTSSHGGTPTRLDVFDARGTYLGAVDAPPRIMVSPAPAVRDGHIAAVVQDEDHVESVVLLEISKPGR